MGARIMDPTSRVLAIAQDVTGAMSSQGIPFNNDLSKKFNSDLKMNLGAFQGLLNVIQNNINNDRRLSLLRKLDWKRLSGDPSTGKTFSQYFLENSINDLIVALDAVISHSPF
jgi:hypothetical protein